MNTHRAPLLRVRIPFGNNPNRGVDLMAARVFYERKYWFVVRRLAHLCFPYASQNDSWETRSLSKTQKRLILLARSEGFEPPTLRFEV